MRQLFDRQFRLSGPKVDHPHARELAGIDQVLCDNPDIAELVLQDLQRGLTVPEEGRKGMTADQVLRVAVLKQLNTFTYEELTFHLADSSTYRAFCGFGYLDEAPKKSTLQRNIKRITEETWEAINRILVGYAAEHGVEDGRKVRTDGTVTETNIHHRPIRRCCGTRCACSPAFSGVRMRTTASPAFRTARDGPGGGPTAC